MTRERDLLTILTAALAAAFFCCAAPCMLTINEPRLARVIDGAIPRLPPTATAEAIRPATVTPTALATFTPLPTRWPTATPRPAPVDTDPRPAAGEDLGPTEQEYLLALADQTQRIAQGLNGITVLSQNPQFGNRDWESGINVSVILIRDAYRVLSELAPPSDMYQYHQALLGATADCDAGARSLGDGVANQNEGAIRRAGELIESCGLKMEALSE